MSNHRMLPNLIHLSNLLQQAEQTINNIAGLASAEELERLRTIEANVWQTPEEADGMIAELEKTG